MNEYSEYETATGRLTGKQCRTAGLPPAAPGRAWIRGRHAPATHRVNLQTGSVDAHAWAVPFEEQKALRAHRLMQRMADHADLQRRWVREIVLALATGQPAPPAAVEALQQIDARAAEMRARLAAIEAAHDQASLDAIILEGKP